jgi:hypothetical protein
MFSCVKEHKRSVSESQRPLQEIYEDTLRRVWAELNSLWDNRYAKRTMRVENLQSKSLHNLSLGITSAFPASIYEDL